MSSSEVAVVVLFLGIGTFTGIRLYSLAKQARARFGVPPHAEPPFFWATAGFLAGVTCAIMLPLVLGAFFSGRTDLERASELAQSAMRAARYNRWPAPPPPDASGLGASSTSPDTADKLTASWYIDPSGRHLLRYWDGSRWTDSVTDGGKSRSDPLA
jgi:hypothetical protein